MNNRRKIPDLTGQHFGKWTVIGPAPRVDSHTCFQCRCECGSMLKIRADALIHGKTRQCVRCARKEYIRRICNRTPEEVREYIQTHTIAEAAEHWNVSKGTMTKYMSSHGIKAVIHGRSGPRKARRSQLYAETIRNRPKPALEMVDRSRKAFNVRLVPRFEEGKNDVSPHEFRRWKYTGRAYLERMRKYERMVKTDEPAQKDQTEA